MKPFMPILLYVLLTACKPVPNQAVITFADTVHTINATQKNTLQTSYSFTNTGTTDLIIKSVHSSCGCAVIQYPKTTIAAGDTSEVVVSYTPQKDTGAIEEVIMVETNTLPILHTLYLRGNIQSSPLADF